MTDRGLNCWEYQQCGRQLGGHREHEMGPCPASIEQSLQGSHSGDAAGRACWVVPGTFCEGCTQGTWEEKRRECVKCSFFYRVEVEEGLDFEPADTLHQRYSAAVASTQKSCTPGV